MQCSNMVKPSLHCSCLVFWDEKQQAKCELACLMPMSTQTWWHVGQPRKLYLLYFLLDNCSPRFLVGHSLARCKAWETTTSKRLSSEKHKKTEQKPSTANEVDQHMRLRVRIFRSRSHVQAQLEALHSLPAGPWSTPAFHSVEAKRRKIEDQELRRMCRLCCSALHPLESGRVSDPGCPPSTNTKITTRKNLAQANEIQIQTGQFTLATSWCPLHSGEHPDCTKFDRSPGQWAVLKVAIKSGQSLPDCSWIALIQREHIYWSYWLSVTCCDTCCDVSRRPTAMSSTWNTLKSLYKTNTGQ